MFTAARWYEMADDSVNLINGVNAGTWTLNDFATLTQAEKNNMMQRNIDVLTMTLLQEAVIDDDSDKTALNSAITTGNQYITDNSQS